MPRQAVQDTPVQTQLLPDWSGGINTAVPADRLSDNEAVDILNFEFNQDSNLVTRRGVTKFLGIAPAQTFGRITSLHYHEDDAGNIHVLQTEGTKLWRMNNLGTAISNITGALVLPDDAVWQWRSFTGLAIGVNGATTGDNPIKVSGTTPTAAALGGTPPRGKYLEIWNNRVWIVDAANPNTLRASALGNAEDWTTAGVAGTITLDVSKNDGDKITGLVAFRERLFIFKRTKIFILSTIGSPNTDPANLQLDIYTTNLGCVAANTIQPVLNDILFMSEAGVASLVSSEVVGNFNAAFLSRNIQALSNYLKFDNQRLHALVVEPANQYWIHIPANINPNGVNECFILDYRNIQQGQIRWTRFKGKAAGTAMCGYFVNGEKKYIIGSNSDEGSSYRPYNYVPGSGNFDDDGDPVEHSITSKEYNLGLPFIRKLFRRWFSNIITLTSTAIVDFVYRFDGEGAKQGSQQVTLTQFTSGAVWDTAEWDNDFWYTTDVANFRVRLPFQVKSFGRKAVKVQFVISNNSGSHGFVVGQLEIHFAVLNERLARNV